MTDKFEFEVGDIVEFGGIRGVVKKHDLRFEPYLIYVEFNNILSGTNALFTKDGHFSTKLAEPLLKLIERPKKKKMVKKTIEVWANIYDDGCITIIQGPSLSLSRQQAEKCSMSGRIACVKLTGEYEVEEEE